ncbi:zinc-coordinating transcription factor SFP1 KNAG_0B06200 [Huiozyma naganishii CBS 8797]|uniref:C2H2-type domain-containing protein n=1 Tax=Huiozyma naganishii (strain ATCC MYA-139 / BCRC 22969 / CBS 8797 / KCTC 17520 / NBRC 10181 / NCYC 3082 / Yp74L-3) TaxID=1071383 RepID=J7R2L1_HUIN7|nr:hypothetical protein KNAG_0B06200 [Kazachstania naganishii CBS 8797]CCK69050.1 hypothetical protein KNAG_0B06200 [Kazachstania naganishii CBS 8797]
MDYTSTLSMPSSFNGTPTSSTTATSTATANGNNSSLSGPGAAAAAGTNGASGGGGGNALGAGGGLALGNNDRHAAAMDGMDFSYGSAGNFDFRSHYTDPFGSAAAGTPASRSKLPLSPPATNASHNSHTTTNNLGLSVSPTTPHGNVNLSKLRRDSIAHSQGMGGVSWGSVTIGSWLRDEVMMRHNTATNVPGVPATAHQHQGQAVHQHGTAGNNKYLNAGRNSISYRRLSTINNLNKNLATGAANAANASAALAAGPGHSPPFNNSTYLPSLEQQYCKDYSCCGLSLPGLHDLLRHYEEAHITTQSSSNVAQQFGGGKKYYSESITKPVSGKQQHNHRKHIIQQQLKSPVTNTDSEDHISRNSNNSNNDNNNNNSTTSSQSSTVQTSLQSLRNTSNQSPLSPLKTTPVNKNAKLASKDPDADTNANANTNVSGQMYLNDNNELVDAVSTNDVFLNSNNYSFSKSTMSNDPHAAKHNRHAEQHNEQSIPQQSAVHSASTLGSGRRRTSAGMGDMDLDFMDDDILGGMGLSHNINHVMPSAALHGNNSNMASGGNTHRDNSLLMNHGAAEEDDIEEDDDDDDEDDDEDDEDDDERDQHGDEDMLSNGNEDNDHSPLSTHDLKNADIGNILKNSFTNNGNSQSDANHTFGTKGTSKLGNLNINGVGSPNGAVMRPPRQAYIDDPARRLYVMDHEEHKPFKCPVIGCDKTYKNQNGLKYHRAHGHQNQKLHENSDGTFTIIDPDSNEPYPEGMGYEKDKPYRCEVCGKRYKNLNGLKYHRGHSTH